jgi:hypothetical protein
MRAGAVRARAAESSAALSLRAAGGDDGRAGIGLGAGVGARDGAPHPLAMPSTASAPTALRTHRVACIAQSLRAGAIRQSTGALAALAFGMRIELGGLSELHAVGTRRDFLRLIGVGGALVLLPGFVDACASDDVTGLPSSGEPFVIDFAVGDAAILQLAFVLEQIEADFYGRVVDVFAQSNLTTTEQALLTDIRNHEAIHRAFLEAALGTGVAFKVTPAYQGLAFTDRAAVLAFAKQIEDLGIAMYNGVAQYVVSSDTLTLLAKIAAVEGRHASAIGDLIAPRTEGFAPIATDNVFQPSKVGAAAQANLVDKIGFANLPSIFVQGPNDNG